MTARERTLGYAEGLRRDVDDRIRSILDSVGPEDLRHVLAGALEGGKRIRPILIAVSCAAAGGRENDALDAAAAVELLHTSSLIHDDIMDGADLRRGRPAVHATAGVPAAILAGDTLIALAFRAIQRVEGPNRTRVLQTFTEAFLQTCEGQAEDLALSGRPDVDPARHRRMVEQKTAKLLEASAAIGAMIGTTDEQAITLLRRFALHLGMAYQVRDDLLDAAGDAAVTGKSSGRDEQNRRQTFLSVRSDASRRRAEEASALVERYTRTACSTLESLPDAPAREHLRILAGSLAGRNS